MKKNNALISVWEKRNPDIADFARQLVDLDWTIYASGGTSSYLADHGLPVIDIATLVGPPILGHRVVTLSREVHAGLLAQDTPEDLAELKRLNIPWFDLVCVDLYPLEEEINSPASTPASVREKTDIGGPTLLSAAAKGQRIVICHTYDRERVIRWLKRGQPERDRFVTRLGIAADYVVSKYRRLTAIYHAKILLGGESS